MCIRDRDELVRMRQEAMEEAINTAMLLLLTLPLKVLMDHYWKKSYTKRMPEFINYVLEDVYKRQAIHRKNMVLQKFLSLVL